MPAVVGAVASAVVASEVGALVGGGIIGAVVGGLAGNIVGGVITSALSPRNPSSPAQTSAQFDNASRGTLINTASNIEPVPVLYGRVKRGGPIALREVSGSSNSIFHKIVVFSEGEIGGIQNFYIDDTISTNSKYSGLATFETHTGTDAQAASSALIAALGGQWSASDQGCGLAYVYGAFTYNTNAYTQEPTITADILGKKVYDPRDTLTKWHHNPALCIRDYLTSSRYGRGIPSSAMDDTTFIAEANHCEERVALPTVSSTFTADASTDICTLTGSNPPTPPAGDAYIATTSGTLPAPLVAGTAYYAVPVGNAQVRLALTYANAAAGTYIDLTTAGSGTHTLTRTSPFTADATADTATFNLSEVFGYGDGVTVAASGGSLPTGLAAATTYYLIIKGDNVVQFAASYANAIAGTAIDLTDAGSGVLTMTPVDSPRYRLDGAINVDQTPLENLRQMLTSCRGTLVFSGGLYKLKIDKATSATAWEFNEDNIVGAWSVQLAGKRNRYNRVTAKFINPAKSWQPDTAVQDSTANRTLDNNALLQEQIDLPFTYNQYGAMRIAQLELKQSRYGLMVSFLATIKGLRAEVGDVVPITHSTPGWTSKLFRIVEIELQANDEVKITGREYDSSVYTLTQLLGTVPAGVPNLARAIPPDPTGFTAQQSAPGTVLFSVNAAVTQAAARVEIRYTDPGDTTWANGISICNIFKGYTSTTQAVPAGSWTFLARSFSALEDPSTNSARADLTVTADGFTTITQRQDAPDWLGTLSNFVLHPSGVLVPDDQHLASYYGWECFDQFVPTPFATCTYTAPEIDKTIDGTARIWTDIVSVLGPGVTVGQATPTNQIDYKTSAGAYDGFENWTIGSVNFRYLKSMLTLDTTKGVAVISGFKTVVDAQPRQESANAVAVAAGGTAITYSRPFHILPNVQITPVGTAIDGARAESPTTSGFTGKGFLAGVATSGTVNWIANGV